MATPVYDKRPSDGSGRRHCACCKRTKCNKYFKLPIGDGPSRVVVRVCGRCVVVNSKKLRAWMDAKEQELK